MLLAASGCGESPPPPENRGAIENVAKWFQLYHTRTGKPPQNEEELVTFVESELSQRGQTLDREKLLTSPRDGQKFVVRYGEPLSNNQEENWVVREQEGYDGKVLVANEFGSSREVDEAELQSLWAGSE